MISAVLIIIIGTEQTVFSSDIVKPSGESDIVVKRGHFLISQLGIPVGPPDGTQENNSVLSEKLTGLEIGFQGFLYGFKSIRGSHLGSGHHLRAYLTFSEDFHGIYRAADPFVPANIFFLAGTQEGEERLIPYFNIRTICGQPGLPVQAAQLCLRVGRRHQLTGKASAEITADRL